jgi:hypothetical protein
VYINTNSKFTFSLTTNNPIPSDGKIIVQLPSDIGVGWTSSTPPCDVINMPSTIISCSYETIGSIRRIVISNGNNNVGISSN